MTKRVWAAIATVAAFLFATSALAAGAKGSTGLGGSSEAILIAEVALLLLVGRGLGEIMQRFGQPAVIGQLLAGLILGPSLFGWVWPHAHDLIFPGSETQKSLISGLANMGVMMLLLLTGMETDLKLVRKVGMPALAITSMGVAIPFACGFTLGQLLPASILPKADHRLVTSLLLGTALSISSIKIVAMVVREMNFMRRNLGQIIVASSILEDTTGWLIVAITLGIAGAGAFSLGSFAFTVLGTLLFLVLSYTIGRKLVFWLIRWVNDTFVSEYAVVTAILIVMCLMALITQAIGVNTVLGAFVAGVLVGESPILTRHIEDQIRGFITAFMMPIFFGLSGLSANLTILKDPNLAMLTIGLVALASFGKFGGAFIGGMFSGLTARESLAVGCGMNARGSTEVIVATIGLSMGALTQNLYTMIVTMAVITTMAMPPMLRWALGRLPLSDDEKARLDKEDLDAKGFVSQFERLLIVADDSANGKFASRLAGFIAGRRGKPITVVELDAPGKSDPTGENAGALAAAATEGVKEGHRADHADDSEPVPEHVEVSSRSKGTNREAIAEEVPKGYDILFIGVDRMRRPQGFAAEIERAAAQFSGPLALVFAGTENIERGYKVLIPVNGTEASRRGAEIAFAVSPPGESSVVALNVADRSADEKGRAVRTARTRAEKALMDDIATLGGRYGFSGIHRAVHTDVTPDAAILAEAKRRHCNLIVLGTNRRVGKRLTLGQTANAVLEKWQGALVVLVT